MLAVRRSDASEPFHRALNFYHWPQWRDTAGESRKVFSERLKNWVGKRYERCDLKTASFLRGDYKITQRWAKVFLKALVERNSVMVEVFLYGFDPEKI